METPEIVVSGPEDNNEPIKTSSFGRSPSPESEEVQSNQYLQVPSAGRTRPMRSHDDDIREASIKQESYDDEPDESLSERLWGLTEMFPEPIRDFCETVTDYTVSGVKTVYQFSCNASWIFFTSSMILFAPVIFETERAQVEEIQRSQQKQVLLGPGSAINTTSGSPALPPMTR